MPKDYYTKYLTVTLANGSKKKLKFYGKTEPEAIKKRDTAEIKYKAGILTFNEKTTLERWIHEWLEVYKKPKVTSSTYHEISGIMQRVYLDQIGRLSLDSLKLSHIQRCLNELEGKSKSYIHRAYIYIKAALEKACENDMLSKNPCRGLTEPSPSVKTERRPLTDTERRLFLEAIQTTSSRCFFRDYARLWSSSSRGSCSYLV